MKLKSEIVQLTHSFVSNCTTHGDPTITQNGFITERRRFLVPTVFPLGCSKQQPSTFLCFLFRTAPEPQVGTHLLVLPGSKDHFKKRWGFVVFDHANTTVRKRQNTLHLVLQKLDSNMLLRRADIRGLPRTLNRQVALTNDTDTRLLLREQLKQSSRVEQVGTMTREATLPRSTTATRRQSGRKNKWRHLNL